MDSDMPRSDGLWSPVAARSPRSHPKLFTGREDRPARRFRALARIHIYAPRGSALRSETPGLTPPTDARSVAQAVVRVHGVYSHIRTGRPVDGRTAEDAPFRRMVRENELPGGSRVVHQAPRDRVRIIPRIHPAGVGEDATSNSELDSPHPVVRRAAVGLRQGERPDVPADLRHHRRRLPARRAPARHLHPGAQVAPVGKTDAARAGPGPLSGPTCPPFRSVSGPGA